MLDTLAFSIWNLGSRSPAAVLRDVRASLGDRRAIATGSLAFIVGAIFLTAGTVLVVPAIVDLPADFLPTEIFAILVALALEHVVGADVRAIATSRKGT